MKYSEIISLQDYFHPVFNLQNEATGYWKQFIPTGQFNNLLEKTLDAVSSSVPANRKSIWVQGTFGTGKSHAGSVIKHLLCDENADIAEYIESRIEKTDINTRLTELRKNKRYFSVVLSGVEGAYNPRTFALSLERSIKEALRKSGHNVKVVSDFERAIDLIENNQALDLATIINNEPELRVIAKTKEDIVNKLRNAKSLLTDMYHGIKSEFLQGYLNEFCYQFNRTKIPLDPFDRLLALTTSYKSNFKHITYRKVKIKDCVLCG